MKIKFKACKIEKSKLAPRPKRPKRPSAADWSLNGPLARFMGKARLLIQDIRCSVDIHCDSRPSVYVKRPPAGMMNAKRLDGRHYVNRRQTGMIQVKQLAASTYANHLQTGIIIQATHHVNRWLWHNTGTGIVAGIGKM
eukprot:GHVU01047051.1.p1 GENE.GHVU01047051.1~~GHVU01047051.1.p1  ORF type:complete len:139 (-),score=0.94 GHVU01047051.1:26-442(-)